MGNISKRILFGKDNGRGFTAYDLPTNRRRQFTYLLKTRFSKLFYVNLLVCLFALPLMIWHLLCLAYSFSFGDINAEIFGKYFQYLLYYKSSLRLLLSIPATYGVAGGLHVIRLISWGEPISLFRAFFKGIKLNLKQFTLFGILYGAFAGLFEAASALLQFVYKGSTLEIIILHGGMLLSFVLLAAISVFLLPLCSTYSIKILNAIKSSSVLAVKTLIKTVGILCITVLPFALALSVGNPYIDIICGVILALFGFSYALAVAELYANSVFDELINANDYPEYYRRGLAPLTASEVENA